MVIMNSIKYSELLGTKKSLFVKKGICLGKTSNSYFIGPILSKRLCSNCVYLRIISSVSYKINKFVSVSKAEEDFLRKFSSKKEIKENGVIEIRGKRIYFTHYIMPVPGCSHKPYEKK